ncbi:hypothetical protein CCR75_003347 [Bremia lactucae]|uniref:Uncharacterized protein n=1 Tax=Bremia lactucae TaxID=4779 RepID=A0A976FI38_BRELC|nr:hypothetical protein CCR75_003347 [Bremia lactucae]
MSYSGGSGGYGDQRGYSSRSGETGRSYDDPNRPSDGGNEGYSGSYGQGYDQRGYDQRGQQSYDQRGGYGSRSGDYSRSSSGYDDYQRGGGGYSSGARGYESTQGDYSASRYDDRSRGGSYASGGGGYGGSGYDDRGGYGGSSSHGQSSAGYENRSGYDHNRGGGSYGGTSSGYDDRSRGYSSSNYDDRSRYSGTRDDRGYSGGRDDRGYGVSTSFSGDRGYGASTSASNDRGYGGSSSISGGGDRSFKGREDRGYNGTSTRDDRSYGGSGDRGYNRRDDRGASDRRGGDRGSDRGGERGGGRGGGRYGGGGGRGGRGESGPGVGTLSGSGYESLGEPVADPRLLDEWTGRAGVRDVSTEDPELQQEFLICRRPGIGRGGKSMQLQVNYFSVLLDGAPTEILKYHVDVARSPDTAMDMKYGPSAKENDATMAESTDDGHASVHKVEKQDKDVEMSDAVAPLKRETRPERPLPRSLVRNVINAALRQYESDFNGIRVVHDGMAAMYAPAMLPWDGQAKTFIDVNPDGISPTPPPPAAGDAPRRPFRGPRTFVVKIKLAEAISTSTLKDYYSNPDVNVMPVLQALDVAARHLGAQRLISVGRNFFSMKKTHPLKGGKELCWGYHQAIRVADRKLLMNVDQAATVFYAPKELMELVLPALNARSANDIRTLSDRDGKNLARVLRKIEVVPTHRKDRKRAIFGISSQPANQTMVDIKGEHLSVADYFSKRYNMTLRYPNLPLVNVGSKRPGKENWLPIELCEVAPGQRCANINDLDTAEIIRQTSQPPRARQETILDQIRQAGFENDPYLAAFGMKVEQRLESTEARVMDPPDVQYANVSERPSGGQWNLRDKRFVEGATMRNWGVVVSANVSERDVQSFIRSLLDMAGKSGLVIEDSNPHLVHGDQYRGAQVEELMKMCFKELEARNRGPPQLILVIKQDKSVGSYSDIKRMSDTILGIPSQCIVSQNVRNAKPQYCANVCLKINMKLSGKNSILREPLPLVSTAPTIIIGADVEHPRSGMGSRPSIASVVASLDRYSAKYVARVAAQKASSDIQLLPHMLRDLFLAYYQSTNRKPEHVLYYRDGVSEGQHRDILLTEMRALRKAFKMISDGYNPPVTFIIVNKRHHMRAFPTNSRDADRKGNVVPGTVIDTGIVDSHRFDFFLYGHSGIQGTSVPCHYTVLHDENKLSADDVQRLTYHLGYTFARCTRSVSFATPAYYAHLAAARARFFLNEGSDGVSTVNSFNSNSSHFDFAELHNELKNCMFFI